MTSPDCGAQGWHMSNDLVFSNVVKRFGEFTAVHNLNLTIEEAEFFSFLGPSGCGKTTILRMVSGFIEPSDGRITLGGQDLAGIGPNRRPTALIFQNLALFPLMSVADNISFGLSVRGVDRATRMTTVNRLLDLIAMPGYADRRIDELSGGQKQRVAIARALAVEPKVLLLDEPLSALDLKLRQHMRAELRDIQKRTGITFIYITHDQGEALAMSDRVAVMSQGHVEQVGVSSDIYNHPETAFVASFVGENNLFAGRVTGVGNGQARLDTAFGPLAGLNTGNLKVGDEGFLFVRPERLRLASTEAKERENSFASSVLGEMFEGISVNISLANPGGRPVTITMSNDGAVQAYEPGTQLSVFYNTDQATILPRGSLASA